MCEPIRLLQRMVVDAPCADILPLLQHVLLMVQRGQEYLRARVDIAAVAAELAVVPIHVFRIEPHVLRGTERAQDIRAARETERHGVRRPREADAERQREERQQREEQTPAPLFQTQSITASATEIARREQNGHEQQRQRRIEQGAPRFLECRTHVEQYAIHKEDEHGEQQHLAAGLTPPDAALLLLPITKDIAERQRAEQQVEKHAAHSHERHEPCANCEQEIAQRHPPARVDSRQDEHAEQADAEEAHVQGEGGHLLDMLVDLRIAVGM